jgi:hypothetical protein
MRHDLEKTGAFWVKCKVCGLDLYDKLIERDDCPGRPLKRDEHLLAMVRALRVLDDHVRRQPDDYELKADCAIALFRCLPTLLRLAEEALEMRQAMAEIEAEKEQQ